MSGLLRLLKDATVEWKRLGEVCVVSKGKQFNKRDMLEEGSYPVINGGMLPSGYAEVFNNEKNTITASQGGISAGFVNFMERRFWLGAHAFSIVPIPEIAKRYNYDYQCFNRFIFHVLKLNQEKLQRSKIGGGIPNLSKEIVLNVDVPMLSRELLSEIVRILDTFMALTDNLKHELILRQKQYEYYENALFFNEKFKRVKLSRLCTVNQGLQIPISKRYKKDGKNRYLYITIQFLKNKSEKQFFIENPSSNVICGEDDILVARTGSTGKIITGVKGCFHNNFFKVNCNELVVKKYMYYLLKSKHMYHKLKKVASFATVADLPHNKFYNLEVPLPSIEEQSYIVSILDKFESLANNPTDGLSAEIALRQKQYKYYRRKLLKLDKDN